MSLVCQDLVVEYSAGGYIVRPIDRLNVEVRDGELALLLGASGCGKTTLLSVLAAILRPAQGSARIGDTEITSLQGRALTDYRQRKVGLVFQAFNLIPSLTASENVQVPLRASGAGAREARQRANRLLERFGLGERQGHRPGELSGGEQQRVALARALVLDPPLVLADEPTAHLDYIQIEKVLELLRQIADEGRAVIVATHDERMVPLADRIVAMSPRAPERGQVTDVRLREGETLFTEGETAELVYVVEEGEIELSRRLAGGGQEVLARHHAGEYFGELGPMFGLRRSATARATQASRLTGLPLSEFRRRFGGRRGASHAGRFAKVTAAEVVDKRL
jgi:putative ABC transport system ATP-binding protein